MGQQNSKPPEKQSEPPQINFLNYASGSGLSIPSQRRTPNTSQIPQDQVWNTIFRWPFGGETVYVTGTFTQWKNPIPLSKVGNEFNVILALPAGVHKYKFIVDGEWKFSLLDPTCLDESGNVNNIIDTTNYNPKVSDTLSSGSGSLDRRSGNSGTSQQTVKLIAPNTIPKTPEIRKSGGLLENLKKHQVFEEGNFDFEAQITPPHLLDIYFINEKEKKIKEVWKKDESQTKNEGNTEGTFRAFESYESISPPTHVVLNHLGMKKTNVEDDSLVFVLTERFKGKYATIKFYTTR